MYEYGASLARIIDGDTIVMEVDVGFYIRQTMILRLRGIDTPEIRGTERPQGLIAKAFVEQQLAGDVVLAIRTFKIEKWGRYVADVYIGAAGMSNQQVLSEGVHLNQLLLDQGLAVPYED